MSLILSAVAHKASRFVKNPKSSPSLNRFRLSQSENKSFA